MVSYGALESARLRPKLQKQEAEEEVATLNGKSRNVESKQVQLHCHLVSVDYELSYAEHVPLPGLIHPPCTLTTMKEISLRKPKNLVVGLYDRMQFLMTE